MKFYPFVIPLVVLVAAAVRLISLTTAQDHSVELPVVAFQSIAAGQELTPAQLDGYGITELHYQRFDTEAVGVVQAGPDRMPGAAGIDDNINGVTDDRSELGATRSDDSFAVLTTGELAQVPGDQVLVLQRGVFVSVERPITGERCRATLAGEDPHGRIWSALIDIR